MASAPDPRSLLYRPGQLTPEDAQALAAETLKACDDGELYLQFIASEAFGFDDGRLKTCDYSRDAGFGLRGVSGEMTGFAHANDISAAAIRRAGARIGHVQFADTPGRHEPGTGMIDFPAAFAALRDTGYSAEVSAEYRPLENTLDALEWIEDFKRMMA